MVAARPLSPALDVLLVPHTLVATRPGLRGRLGADSALVRHLQGVLQLPQHCTGVGHDLQRQGAPAVRDSRAATALPRPALAKVNLQCRAIQPALQCRTDSAVAVFSLR